MNNETDVSIKFKNQITGEKKLERYAEQLKIVNAVLKGMDTSKVKDVESSASTIKDIAKSTNEMSRRTKIAFDYALVSRFASGIKRLASSFGSLTKQSFDYLENFNLFQVAFKGNYDSATRFVNKMAEMYGLDESWLIQTTGKFKQLANAMGVTEEVGERVSQLLTEMSLDISSLYNVDFSRASSVLQSSLAGQTKPIRGLAGADITQATLQTTLDNLGIENTVKNLSFAEKRLLIIISLTHQLQGSIGDLGRTLESPSNQMRILNDQWERLTRAVGNVFLPILAKILPYLNAILMVLTEIISTFAALVGFKEEDYDFFDSASTGAWDLDEGLKSAGASAKKLKQGLRGFDKLNVITTPSSASGGVGGTGGTGINPKLLDAFNKTFEDYQKTLSDVENKATRIRDKIMEWLGFTKLIDEKTGDVSFKFDHITGGTVLGALAVGGSILLGASSLLGIFKKISGLSFAKTLGSAGSQTGAGASGLLGILKTLTLLTVDVFLIKIAIDGYKEVDKEAKDLSKRMENLKNMTSKSTENWKKNTDALIKNAKEGKNTKKQNELLADGLLKNIHNTDELSKSLEEQKRTGNLVVDMWNSLNGTTGKLIKTQQTLNEEQQHDVDLLIEMNDNGLLNEEQKKRLIKLFTVEIEQLKDERNQIANNERDWKIYNDRIEKLQASLGKIKSTYKGKIELDTKDALKKVETLREKILKIFELNVKGSSGGGHSGGTGRKDNNYANGGLPPVGQIMRVNERGPELIGQVGGQSFVANQNQVVDFLDRKIGNAQKNSSPQVINIYLDKNKKLASYMINDLQDMAITNGKPIEIGG